jgi:mRNA interferase MazF
MAKIDYADIFWVDFPPRDGREQSGRRPALIWQDMAAFPLPTILLIPSTTQLAASRFGATVLVQPSQANGLSALSLALVFQLGSWDVRRLQARIGRLDDPYLLAIADMAKKLQRLP